MKFLFGKKKNIITVLEIDNDRLKIVQAQLFGKERKISRIIVEKITFSAEEKVSEQIGSLFKKLSINPKSFAVSISHQLAVIKNLELPSVNAAEIKDMVELQIGKHTPFAKDEIIYDYEIINTNAEGYSRIILVIVHQDVIGSYFKILEGIGLKTEKIVLSSEGLFAWHRFACKEEITDQPYVLIDVDYDKSDFTVILKGNIVFCGNISIGFSHSLNNMDKWQEKFVEEINRSIYAYHSEIINEEISKIIITGAEMLTASFDEAVLKDKLGLPVKIIPQLRNIPLTEECLSSYNNIAKDISVSCLFGLVLSYPEQKINLVPAHLQIERGIRERGRDLYFFGIYLAFILATVSSIFLGRIYSKELYSRELKQETLKIHKKVDRLNNMMEETEAIKKRTRTKNLSLNIIFEKHSLISPDIYLTSLRFNGKDLLIVRGVSNTMSEIFKFLNALEKSEYFQNVKTKFVTTHKIKDKDLTEFEIVCPLDMSLKELLTSQDNKNPKELLGNK